MRLYSKCYNDIVYKTFFRHWLQLINEKLWLINEKLSFLPFLRNMYYVYFNEGTLHFKDNWLSLHVDDERKEIKYPCQYFIQSNSTYLESVILRLWDTLFLYNYIE